MVGALGEFLFLLPGLRTVRVGWRPVLDLRHPAVRQALRLYAPIVGFLLITFAQQNVDLFLIGRTPGNPLANATALQSATTLIQFPTGLVAAALTLLIAGGAGVAVYLALARLLDLEELRLLGGIVRERLGRRR